MLTLTALLHSIIIGIVQGISEWLPISSKTQVLIASSYLLNLNYAQAYTFGLFIEIGTVIAAVIYFRRDLWNLVKMIMRPKLHPDKRLLVYVIVATVATGIVGAPLYLVADSITGVSIGIPMLVVGAVLIGDAVLIRYTKKRAGSISVKKFADLRLRDYIIVGITQGIAALPGVSRSGITTSTMLLMKVEPDEAFRLSFIIGIFASTAAFLLTLVASHSNVTAALAGIGITGLIVAIVVATIISLFLIDFLIKVAGKAQIVYVTGGLGVLAIAAGLLYLVFGI